MTDRSNASQVAAEIRLFDDALPSGLFERLVQAVRAIGDERLKGKGSYTTNFWFPRNVEPTNLAEESIERLLSLVDPGSACIGTEWWLGRVRYGKRLRLHFDRDLVLEKKTGETIHPLWSSVLYLNAYPSSPTVILEQASGVEAKTSDPENMEGATSVEAVPNRYLVFPGNLLHGVVSHAHPTQRDEPGEDSQQESELRLTLLVNYWHRRPLPPICSDYDGSVYAPLKHEVP